MNLQWIPPDHPRSTLDDWDLRDMDHAHARLRGWVEWRKEGTYTAYARAHRHDDIFRTQLMPGFTDVEEAKAWVVAVVTIGEES